MNSSAEQQARLNAALGSKYQILCSIGAGGMAEVWLARHRFHGGLFAVKVLRDHLAVDPSVVSRFEHEARMAASLANHPNIVPIFDIGEGQGLHFLVMQFVAGEDLATYIRRQGRLDLPSAANVVAQATEALSCAEEKRIVHRDLKPANMLLDEGGRVRLLDFGISRITDLSDSLTRPGESLGTPYYMSPEQIRGEPCDTRSDLYSLGVVFFELLTGCHPFEKESATAVQMAHLTTPPPSLLSIDPALPAACDSIIQKLMAKVPQDRYQNTAELLHVLTSYGASTGPGVLRPAIPAELQEAIHRAQSLPLDGRTTSTPSSPTTNPAVSPTPQSVSPTPIGAASAAPIPAVPAKKSSGAKTAFALFVGLMLVAALAGAFLWMHRAKSPTQSRVVPTPPLPAQSASPPLVYSDGHGRMLLVPAGAFLFTPAAGGADQQVTLPAYYIDESEVSNAEYQRFCAATGHAPPTADFTAHPDLPVSNVSYDDAIAYATWAGKRLPTEQEWEKAARGTDGRLFPWGNTPWTDNVPVALQPVVSDPLHRSPYGAYNMAGNVWEWTTTPYSPTADEKTNLERLFHGQIFSARWLTTKGGSFAPGGAVFFNVTRGRSAPTDLRLPWLGFRCVRDAGSS